MFDQVLLPTGGGKGATPVVEAAIELAGFYDATLHVIYIIDQPATVYGAGEGVPGLGNLLDGFKRKAEEATDDVVAQAADRHVGAKSAVQCGKLPDDILTYVEEHDIDVIVMGTRGQTGIKRALLGSVTEDVIRHAEIPVLTLHRDSGQFSEPPGPEAE